MEQQLFEKDPKTSQIPMLLRPSPAFFKDIWRRFKKNKLAVFCLGLLSLILFMSVIGPSLLPFSYEQQNIMNINQGPNGEHWFGTDELGRDIFVRVWQGARVSLSVAFIAVFLNVIIGTLYGGLSGLKGGLVDNIMMRIIDIIYSIPAMIWIILLMVAIGPGIKTMMIVFTIVGWGGMARLVRGQVLQIREMEYIQAAGLFGANKFRLITKHLLPNCIGPIMVELTFAIPSVIYTEAFLSYIGLGVPVPLASWGSLANDGAKMLLVYPYQLLFPSLMIVLTIFSLNIIGDGLKEALDPRVKD